MKQALSLLLALAMCLSLCACAEPELDTMKETEPSDTVPTVFDEPKPTDPMPSIPDDPQPTDPLPTIPDDPKPTDPDPVIPDDPKPTDPDPIVPDDPKPTDPAPSVPDDPKPVQPPPSLPEDTDPSPAVGSMDSNHTITLAQTLPADVYTLRYESANGILNGYALICRLAPGEAYDHFIGQNTAPQAAVRIGVYASSGERMGKIPFAPSFKQNLGNKRYSFGAISDPHVGYGDEKFANALTLLTQREKVSFITIAGDLTDSCTQWETYQSIINRYANSTPVYTITGNHDTPFWRGYTTGEHYNNEDITEYTPAIKNLVETYSGHSLYYSFARGNDVFIMMGVQSNYGGRMFTRAQLQWLYETLEANKNKRCFLIGHVPPDGGSGNANGWSDKEDMAGTEQTILQSLLEHYPNVTFFHGHTHQAFRLQAEADDAIYDRNWGCHSVHVPAVGGTRGPLSGDLGGSQGYIVDVYSGGIVLRGIDFVTGEYLPIAQYCLDTSLVKVPANTYVDKTNTINCSKVEVEWKFDTHINYYTGEVQPCVECSSTNQIALDPDKKYYFHTAYESPYGVDVYCYDASGAFLGSVVIDLSGNNRYLGPMELNDLVADGTASIRLRMWTGGKHNRKTAPIFITEGKC